MKKITVVNIGNKGVILSVINGNKVLDKLEIDELNQKNLETVNNFFTRNKRLNVIIALDTVAQNYNYKIFPPLNYFDLARIANRRFENEIPKNDLKYKKFLYKNSLDKKSTYLFVSASTDSPLREWLAYFDIIKNNLLGIYMIPLETVDFAKKIMLSLGFDRIIKEKNNWILITYNNKVSDLRQVVIYNNNLAFTRLISLDSTGDNLEEFAKNDIVRTSEYIKRFDSSFTFNKLTIINILDEENKAKLKELKVKDAKVLNFTPYEVDDLLKFNNINKDEKFLDTTLDLFITNNRKRTRFSNKKINTIYYLTLLLNFVKKVSFLSIFVSMIAVSTFIFMNFNFNKKIKGLKNIYKNNQETLEIKSKEEFGMKTEELDKIIDAGEIRNIIVSKKTDPLSDFEKIYRVINDLGLVYDFTWTLNNFNYQNLSNNSEIKTTYNMSLINRDGNPNKIISKYNELNSRLKNIFKNESISMTKIESKDIDFSKKYYVYPIKLEITKK